MEIPREIARKQVDAGDASAKLRLELPTSTDATTVSDKMASASSPDEFAQIVNRVDAIAAKLSALNSVAPQLAAGFLASQDSRFFKNEEALAAHNYTLHLLKGAMKVKE